MEAFFVFFFHDAFAASSRDQIWGKKFLLRFSRGMSGVKKNTLPHMEFFLLAPLKFKGMLRHWV